VGQGKSHGLVKYGKELRVKRPVKKKGGSGKVLQKKRKGVDGTDSMDWKKANGLMTGKKHNT